MAETLETKSFGPFEVKDAVKGEVTAVVNTMNIVDREGDVILPGAIKSGTVVKLSAYRHDSVLAGQPPAGKGVIRVENNQAIVDGRFFMGTTRGRDAFETTKEMGEHGEWSIGFRGVQTAEMTDEWKALGAKRLIAGLDLIEVSPVFEGANQMTATLVMKSATETLTTDPATNALIVLAPVGPSPEEVAATEAEVRDAEAKAAALRELAREEFERFQRTRKRLGLV